MKQEIDVDLTASTHSMRRLVGVIDRRDDLFLADGFVEFPKRAGWRDEKVFIGSGIISEIRKF